MFNFMYIEVWMVKYDEYLKVRSVYYRNLNVYRSNYCYNGVWIFLVWID